VYTVLPANVDADGDHVTAPAVNCELVVIADTGVAPVEGAVKPAIVKSLTFVGSDAAVAWKTTVRTPVFALNDEAVYPGALKNELLNPANEYPVVAVRVTVAE